MKVRPHRHLFVSYYTRGRLFNPLLDHYHYIILSLTQTLSPSTPSCMSLDVPQASALFSSSFLIHFPFLLFSFRSFLPSIGGQISPQILQISESYEKPLDRVGKFQVSTLLSGLQRGSFPSTHQP